MSYQLQQPQSICAEDSDLDVCSFIPAASFTWNFISYAFKLGIMTTDKVGKITGVLSRQDGLFIQ